MNYDEYEGVYLDECQEGGSCIRLSGEAGWLRFDDADFRGGIGGFEARCSSSQGGGRIELRLDERTARLSERVTVPETGGRKCGRRLPVRRTRVGTSHGLSVLGRGYRLEPLPLPTVIRRSVIHDYEERHERCMFIYDSGDTGLINLDNITITRAPTTIEAETATTLGFAAVYNDSSASGGQAVQYLHVSGNGIQFSNVPAATSLTVKFASTNSGTYSMYVNGVKTNTINFTGNGVWAGAYTSVTVPVNIPAGATLKLQCDTGDKGWNVDSIILQ